MKFELKYSVPRDWVFCSVKLSNLSDYKYCNASSEGTVISNQTAGSCNGCGTKHRDFSCPLSPGLGSPSSLSVCSVPAGGSLPVWNAEKVFWLF